MPKKYNYTKKTGRPTKTVANDLPKNWKDICVQGSLDGKAEVEIRRDICVSKGRATGMVLDLWYKLQEREKEFSETIKACKGLCEAWWIQKGRDSLTAKCFKEHVWKANMVNRFRWRDKQELDHGIQDETLDKYAQYSVKQLAEAVDCFTRGSGACSQTSSGKAKNKTA